MIDFIIHKESNNSIKKIGNKISLSIDFVLDCKQIDYHIENGNNKLIIIGDCINPTDIDINKDGINYLIDKLKGNFYAFLVQDEVLHITSSAFGLLPIYYYEDYSCFSSSVSLIKDVLNMPLTENKKWIINQQLFNYQFGTDTIFSEIKLFPSMSYLKFIRDEYIFTKYYSVQNEFEKKPKSWKKSLNTLSDLFIETTNNYIPNENSVISFTGGFDGRTLVSVATHFNKKFTTFSYGKMENDDVHIPQNNSKKLNIPYFWLNLGQEYVDKEYNQSAKNYIESTGGGNGFLYAHVDYSARKVKEKSEYLISGICGSELFRAAHSSGAVTSKALMDLFFYDDFDLFKESIYKSKSLQFLDNEIFKNSIDEVINDAWDYKTNLNSSLDKNQKLYVFVYEEIFRKFFGAWLVTQMKYIKVRTPFIDFDFFKAILKTELSGAYSDFLTENPLKRFKGQVLYADIIKKTNKELYYMKTGKGYSPSIVREPILRPLLMLPFVIKRFKRGIKQTNLDNLGLITGIKNYNMNLLSLNNIKYINKEKLKIELDLLNPYTHENERDAILTILSLITYKESLDE